MALFEFNDGPNATLTSNGSVNFTEDGVVFTLSATGQGGQDSAFYFATGNGGDGYISLADSQSPGGTYTLSLDQGVASDNFSNPVVTLSSISGTWTVTFVHATNTALNDVQSGITAPGQITAAAGDYSAIKFSQSAGSGYLGIDSLNTTIVCYLEGTGIDTPRGRVAIEDLRPGDHVLRADGGTTEVLWVGRQWVDTRLTHPARVNPIRIAAGALDDQVPARDLYVSPDHAIALDGMLFQASTLVNGSTITVVPRMPAEGFAYYHVETTAHEVILAEGCPAESFVDVPDRASFENGADRADAPKIREMDLPRIATARLVPEPLRARLAARAAALAPARAA